VSQTEERALLEHIDLYRLTTVEAAACAACDGDRRRATGALAYLVRRGELHRFGQIYTHRATPPKPRDAWRDLAILSYCCLGTPPQPCIPKERLVDAFGPHASRLGLRPPTAQACIFDQNDRLARLWVEPYTEDRAGMPLQKVLAALQRAARDKSFHLWAHLALTGEFGLLVLCRSRGRADELARWLGRVPLSAIAGSTTVEVPVATAAIP